MRISDSMNIKLKKEAYIMSYIDAGVWFAEKVRYEQFNTVINGITFPLIPLTDEHMESIELAESYDEMIEIAVRNSMASGDARVADDSKFNKYYSEFWEKHDGDPSVKNQLGEYICENSKLSEAVDEAYAEKVETAKRLDEEKRAAEAKNHFESEVNIVDGDNLTADQLAADAAEFVAA